MHPLRLPPTEGEARKRKAKEKLREVWVVVSGSWGPSPGRRSGQRRLETPRPPVSRPSFLGHLAAPVLTWPGLHLGTSDAQALVAFCLSCGFVGDG